MSSQQQAVFTFNGNLQDFLPKSLKGKPLVYAFKGKPSVKDAIEALGVPHVEVGAVLMKGARVSFQEPLASGAKVEVLPVLEVEASATIGFLQPALPSPIRFVLDVHLGKLARLLRLLGFDTLYDTQYTDKIITRLAQEEQRVVITRDVGLLKQKALLWGYWLRSQDPKAQLTEALDRFHLQGPFNPFTRCLLCNHLVAPVSKEDVIGQLLPKTKELFEEFYQCTGCQKVYWKGSHYEKMVAFVQQRQQLS